MPNDGLARLYSVRQIIENSPDHVVHAYGLERHFGFGQCIGGQGIEQVFNALGRDAYIACILLYVAVIARIGILVEEL